MTDTDAAMEAVPASLTPSLAIASNSHDDHNTHTSAAKENTDMSLSSSKKSVDVCEREDSMKIPQSSEGMQERSDPALEIPPPSQQETTIALRPSNVDGVSPDDIGLDSHPVNDAVLSDSDLDGMSTANTAVPPESISITFIVHPICFHFQETLVADTLPCSFLYDKISRRLHIPTTDINITFRGNLMMATDIFQDVCQRPHSNTSHASFSSPTEKPSVEDLEMDIELSRIPSYLCCLTEGDEFICAFSTELTQAHDASTLHPSRPLSCTPDVQDFIAIAPAPTFSKVLNIVMVRAFQRKPFLGGYRHRKNGLVYHDACTQTNPIPLSASQIMAGSKMRIQKFARSTQSQGITRSIQTIRECSTQMDRVDYICNTRHDYIRIAKAYFTAEAYQVVQIQQVIRLQAFTRGCFARQKALDIRTEKAHRILQAKTEHATKAQEHTLHMSRELERRMHPKTIQDFTMLYNELEAWRQEETARIHEANIPAHEIRFAFQELLAKETKLLQKLDRMKAHAIDASLHTNIQTMMHAMSKNKEWNGVSVATPATTRAQELCTLYTTLCNHRTMSVDERLDVLLQVKWMMEASAHCTLTLDLVILIDREADLLSRGRRVDALQGLRSRIAHLFLRFLETPAFNPEASKYIKVPVEYTGSALGPVVQSRRARVL